MTSPFFPLPPYPINSQSFETRYPGCTGIKRIQSPNSNRFKGENREGEKSRLDTNTWSFRFYTLAARNVNKGNPSLEKKKKSPLGRPPRSCPRVRGWIIGRGARCRDIGGRGQRSFVGGSSGAIRIPRVLAVVWQQVVGDFSFGEIRAPLDALLHGLELGLVDVARGGGDGWYGPEGGAEVERRSDGDAGHHTGGGNEGSAEDLEFSVWES